MKKSKYQQYFHCFIVCILVPYVIWLLVEYINYCNKRHIQKLITGKALIIGSHLFQYGYPNVRQLLKGSVYLRVWLLAE